MTQVFDNEKVVPVTVIEAGPCFILQVKSEDNKDKYNAVKLGFKKDKKEKFKFIKEFRGISNLKKGDELKVDIFQLGDKVKISGKSKGKGFAGAMKRWNFKGKSASHGTKHEMRTLGSVGSRFPQRVIKGRKMPGRMGFDQVTLSGLEIIKTDLENNIIAVKGAVPGRKGTLLKIYG